MSILQKGSQGDDVRQLQTKLKGLGFPLDADGIFGDRTQHAVITLQSVFGYDVDGKVGPATQKLVEQQAGYGWNLEAARKAYVKPAS